MWISKKVFNTFFFIFSCGSYVGFEIWFVVGYWTLLVEPVPIASHFATLCHRHIHPYRCKQSKGSSPHQWHLFQTRKEGKEPWWRWCFCRQEGTLCPIRAEESWPSRCGQGRSLRVGHTQGQESSFQIYAKLLCFELWPMPTPFTFLRRRNRNNATQHTKYTLKEYYNKKHEICFVMAYIWNE